MRWRNYVGEIFSFRLYVFITVWQKVKKFSFIFRIILARFQTEVATYRITDGVFWSRQYPLVRKSMIRKIAIGKVLKMNLWKVSMITSRDLNREILSRKTSGAALHLKISQTSFPATIFFVLCEEINTSATSNSLLFCCHNYRDFPCQFRFFEFSHCSS